MKAFLVCIIAVSLLILCCACTAGESASETTLPQTQPTQASQISSEDTMLAEAQTVADAFIQAFYTAEYNRVNEMSAVDLKGQIDALNQASGEVNTGVYYEGEQIIWDGDVFASTQECLDAVHEHFSSMVLKSWKLKDLTLHKAEDMASVLEAYKFSDKQLLSACEIAFDQIAVAQYDVQVQGGIEANIYEGTTTVLLVHENDRWCVFSPCIMGVLCGYQYIINLGSVS